MLVRLVLGTAALLAVPPASAQAPLAPAVGSADQAGNQIRLNRPPGGGDEPARPAESGPAILADITPEESLRLFESAGFGSVRLVEDAKGGDYLRLRSGNLDSFIFYLNCNDRRCRSLMFTAFLGAKRGASLNFVNSYNLKTLHTKMARNDAGEIVLTMAASLNRGVTEEHLRSLGSFWIQVHRDALDWR